MASAGNTFFPVWAVWKREEDFEFAWKGHEAWKGCWKRRKRKRKRRRRMTQRFSGGGDAESGSYVVPGNYIFCGIFK